jgi:hypothetical protein
MNCFSVVAIALLCASLAACATTQSAPEKMTGWQTVDGVQNDDPAVQRAASICQSEGMRAADPLDSPIMRGLALEGAVKTCMAKRGYVPRFD